MSQYHAKDGVGRMGLVGTLFACTFFGTLAAWSSTARLSSAALAPGKVAVEGNRKAIQHSEGGPIQVVLVREGQRVIAGQPLLILDLSVTRAEAEVYQSSVLQMLARQARLRAELTDSTAPVFPAQLLKSNGPQARLLMEQEASLFKTRKAAYLGTITLLRQQISGAQEQIKALRSRAGTTHRQRDLIREEIASIQPLVAKGLVTKTRALALERNSASLQGDLETIKASVSGELNKIRSTEIQIIQSEKERKEAVSKELAETESKLAEFQPRLAAALSRLGRATLVAPEEGYVFSLTVFSKGASITPGQTVMEIVPSDATLVLVVDINPKDINYVAPGQDVIIHLLPYKRRQQTIISGKLDKVSADRFDSPRGDASYFRGTVKANIDDLKRANVDLVPGMPVEVLIRTGDRTVAEYFLAPLYRLYDFALRER